MSDEHDTFCNIVVFLIVFDSMRKDTLFRLRRNLQAIREWLTFDVLFFGTTVRPLLPRWNKTNPPVAHWNFPRKSVKKVKQTVEKKAPKLRKKIQPGQVLILLASKFRGRRVIFLKQLESGLLLVTGPYALNGVPFKRVNQRYCIATSTKVDLAGADVSITDAYFAREKTNKNVKTQEKFFASEAPKKELSQEKKDKQKKTDDVIIKGLTNDTCPLYSRGVSL